MLEQEMAGIAKAVLEAANNPTPYYNKILEDFIVPSIYFPPAEVSSSVFSLSSYCVSYLWFIKVFAIDKNEAFTMARVIMETILKKRCLVSLMNLDGSPTNESLRINTPSIKGLEGDAYQLTVEWDVVRRYEEEIAPKMQAYEVEGWGKREDEGSLSPNDSNYIV